MKSTKIAALATPVAFVLLVAAMAMMELIQPSQGLWFSLAVVAGFGPSGMWQPGGWRRRASETMLLAGAAAVVLIQSPVMRQMIVAPVIVLAVWVAWSAAVRQKPVIVKQVVLTASFGAAVRLVLGFSSVSAGWVGVVGAIAAVAIVPGALAAVRPSYGLIGLSLILPLTLKEGPVLSWVLAGCGLVALWVCLRLPRSDRPLWEGAGLFPGLGAAMLVVVALGGWGLPALGDVLPGFNWVGGAIVLTMLAASIKLPPSTAGACAMLVCLLIGSPLAPTPEGGGLALDQSHLKASMKPGTGSPYVVDVIVDHLEMVRPDAKIATIAVGAKHVALRMHEDADGKAGLAVSRLKECPGNKLFAVLRPVALPEKGWRRADRIVLDVPAGVVPVINRKEGLPQAVVVRLAIAGPSQPTPPRDFPAERWLWVTAAAVALLQLLSGRWRGVDAWPPWMLLTTGLIASRAAVEPFHLIIERHAVDLCLAAFLMAWIPLAVGWLKRGRTFFVVACFLVPLALATPHLTPSLWGDEPYHVALAESVIQDLDFDLANNLVGGGAIREIVLAPDRLFHSPVLAGLLLPGFLVAGRSGALFVLALAGAACVALVVTRYRELASPPRRAVSALVLVACLSYPLVTFSTQIWPAMLGALVIAASLLLVTRGKWPRVAAAVMALIAVAAKTRLALMTLPVVLAGWWRGSRRSKANGVMIVIAAAAGAMAIGWWAMGHPFGYYRRLHHLLPTDVVLALRVVSGLVFDVAGGLAWTAPLWLLAIIAMPLLWRLGGDGERALLVGGGATVLALLHSIEWYGGGSAPARYLIPMLPAVLLTLGVLLVRPQGFRRLIVFSAPAAFFSWWAMVTRPHFSVNPGDGRWWLTNSLSRRLSADARALFPSFLTPGTACVVVPLVVIMVGVGLWWICRKPRRAWWLARLAPAVWLIAALGVIVAIDLRADTVVEVESAQVARQGGAPAPAIGTPARFTHPNGWLISDGDALTIPINLNGGEHVVIEGKVVPPGWAGDLDVRWNTSKPTSFSVRRGPEVESIVVPDPPGPGRHRISLRWSGRDGAVLFVDRVVINRKER